GRGAVHVEKAVGSEVRPFVELGAHPGQDVKRGAGGDVDHPLDPVGVAGQVPSDNSGDVTVHNDPGWTGDRRRCGSGGRRSRPEQCEHESAAHERWDIAHSAHSRPLVPTMCARPYVAFPPSTPPRSKGMLFLSPSMASD